MAELKTSDSSREWTYWRISMSEDNLRSVLNEDEDISGIFTTEELFGDESSLSIDDLEEDDLDDLFNDVLMRKQGRPQ
jgi:hypothetical protein